MALHQLKVSEMYIVQTAYEHINLMGLKVARPPHLMVQKCTLHNTIGHCITLKTAHQYIYLMDSDIKAAQPPPAYCSEMYII